jgi:hypothetical protein
LCTKRVDAHTRLQHVFFFLSFEPTTFDMILIDQSHYVTVEDEGADADAETESPTTEGPPASLFFLIITVSFIVKSNVAFFFFRLMRWRNRTLQG